MADPFTIRIFVPDGDPEGLRIIDRMNWTGLGIVSPREGWGKIKQRAKLSRNLVFTFSLAIQRKMRKTIFRKSMSAKLMLFVQDR